MNNKASRNRSQAERSLSIAALRVEMNEAELRYGPFNSPHEVYGVLAEEMDELLGEITAHCWKKAREEAFQIAAVALRFFLEDTKLEREGKL